jgi:predicted aconitase with swiveling domain
MGSLTQFQGDPILAGEADGEVLAADMPLSFWGGFDSETGQIIDQRHPLAGQIASGRILVIPSGRGSCSGSGVLLEAIRNGTAPAAIITARLDPIICLGAILGDELYGIHPPIIVADQSTTDHLSTGDWLTIAADGHLTLVPRPDPIAPLPLRWERGGGEGF